MFSLIVMRVKFNDLEVTLTLASNLKIELKFAKKKLEIPHFHRFLYS